MGLRRLYPIFISGSCTGEVISLFIDRRIENNNFGNLKYQKTCYQLGSKDGSAAEESASNYCGFFAVGDAEEFSLSTILFPAHSGSRSAASFYTQHSHSEQD